MAQYEAGDIVTYYFIVFENDGNKGIRAWTDNKDLAKFYLEFHNSKSLVLKSITKQIEDIMKILEENVHDKIQICNIITRDRNRDKHSDPSTMICIPATDTEITFINEESSDFMISDIRYSFLNDAIPYLKKKYQNALEDIFLPSIIRKVCHNKENDITSSIQMDQLLVLFKSFPDTFGK